MPCSKHITEHIATAQLAGPQLPAPACHSTSAGPSHAQDSFRYTVALLRWKAPPSAGTVVRSRVREPAGAGQRAQGSIRSDRTNLGMCVALVQCCCNTEQRTVASCARHASACTVGFARQRLSRRSQATAYAAGLCVKMRHTHNQQML